MSKLKTDEKTWPRSASGKDGGAKVIVVPTVPDDSVYEIEIRSDNQQTTDDNQLKNASQNSYYKNWHQRQELIHQKWQNYDDISLQQPYQKQQMEIFDPSEAQADRIVENGNIQYQNPEFLPPLLQEDKEICKLHKSKLSHLCKKHMTMVWDKCIFEKHKGWKTSLTSLGILAHEVAVRYSNVADKMQNSMTMYFNTISYEDKMIEIRKKIKTAYNNLHEQLYQSEKSVLNGLKEIVDKTVISDAEKKIILERTSEYQHVLSQISKMKDEIDLIIESGNYARIYNEKDMMKKFMSSIEIVNDDIQNHIADDRLPIDEIICETNNLIHRISAITDIQVLKLRKYKVIGIPSTHMYKPFHLFFKKYKKKIIENDKELSLLDAGIYLSEKWDSMSLEEKQKYYLAASDINSKIQDKNKKITDTIEPDFKRIKEERDRNIRRERERRVIEHFSSHLHENIDKQGENIREEDAESRRRRIEKSNFKKESDWDDILKYAKRCINRNPLPIKRAKIIDLDAERQPYIVRDMNIQLNQLGETINHNYNRNYDIEDDANSRSDSIKSNSNFQVEQNQIEINPAIKEEEQHRRRRGNKRKQTEDGKQEQDHDESSSDRENKVLKTEEVIQQHIRDPSNDIKPPLINNVINIQPKSSWTMNPEEARKHWILQKIQWKGGRKFGKVNDTKPQIIQNQKVNAPSKSLMNLKREFEELKAELDITESQ